MKLSGQPQKNLGFCGLPHIQQKIIFDLILIKFWIFFFNSESSFHLILPIFALESFIGEQEKADSSIFDKHHQIGFIKSRDSFFWTTSVFF